jgi:ribosomal protein S18 acetylase RimI-like enzyme
MNSLENISIASIEEVRPADIPELVDYLQQLSADTKQRFGPHPFDTDSVYKTIENTTDYRGFIARDSKHQIIAYSIVKLGYLEHDKPRLETYGLQLNHAFDATYAPSVADFWQGKGVGRAMLEYIIESRVLKRYGRLILWGGVQVTNHRAVAFYNRNGFIKLGEFEYFGMNYDMYLPLK